MKITVVGTGYVGLVSGACLSEVGNDVLCLDVNPEKIRILEEGGIPIFEPGLQEMVQRNVAAGRLRFTTDIDTAVTHGLLQFIAVGTPPSEDGSAIRRRRHCPACGARFTTFERVQLRDLTVLKKDGKREPFDRAKLERAIGHAARKRDVSADKIEQMVTGIQRQLETRGDEISSSEIGEARQGPRAW